jgi:hypothetical protein
MPLVEEREMKRILCVVGVMAALAGPRVARASDPIGIYAVIDKVVLEPDDQAPTRIQVWGTFCVGKEYGRSYLPPAYGYLYYGLDAGKEDVCRREWSDLKKSAGTGSVIGFGRTWNVAMLDRVRNAAEKPEHPAAYPLGQGLVRMRPNEDWQPLKELYTMPAPIVPGDSAEVKPGTITLATRNILSPAHSHSNYVFEIEDGQGHKEVSPAVQPGAKETKWSPKMEVKAGTKYRWRVGAVDGAWKGPQASATFQGQPRP